MITIVVIARIAYPPTSDPSHTTRLLDSNFITCIIYTLINFVENLMTIHCITIDLSILHCSSYLSYLAL